MHFFRDSSDCKVIKTSKNTREYRGDNSPKVISRDLNEHDLELLSAHVLRKNECQHPPIAPSNTHDLHLCHELLLIGKGRNSYKERLEHEKRHSDSFRKLAHSVGHAPERHDGHHGPVDNHLPDERVPW